MDDAELYHRLTNIPRDVPSLLHKSQWITLLKYYDVSHATPKEGERGATTLGKVSLEFEWRRRRRLRQ